jgi:ClpP class serine protease
MSLSPAFRFLVSQQWAMELDVFTRMVALIERHAYGERFDAKEVARIVAMDDEDAPAAAGPVRKPEPGMTIAGDTAVIPIRGVLARYADAVNGICQPRGRSAESVQSDLLKAAAAGVNRIVMVLDSPGGQVAGTAETARLVAQLSSQGITMVAFVDGMAASGAYWIASQADEIVASATTAIVGSIGAAQVFSERIPDDKREKLHVITSAPAKPGGPVNEAQLANMRAVIMNMAAAFGDAVQMGRGLTDDQRTKVVTAEIWTAQQALALGLVDRVASLADVLGTPSLASAIPAPGAPPAATAAVPGENPVKLTMNQVLALIEAHPTHSALISQRAKADDDEGAIRLAIAGADLTTATATIGDLRSQITANATAHQTALAELQGKVTAAEARATKAEQDLVKARAHAPAGDPGADNPATSGGLDPNAKTCTGAQYDAMSVAEREAFAKRGGVVLDA